LEIIKVNLPKNHEIGWAACTHFGNSNQYLEGIHKYVDWLKSGKNRYGFINGDIAEAIHKTDKRHEASTHQQLILDQYADAVKVFKPVKQKLLGATSGNHDWKINSYGDFVAKCFCEPLDIAYGTYSCKLIVRDENLKTMYKAFVTHGNGSIKSAHHDPILREAQEKAKIKKKLAVERHGDCLVNVIAHFHKAHVIKPFRDLYLVDDGVKIKQQYISEPEPTAKWIDEDLRWYLCVPSFLHKYSDAPKTSSYAERGGFGPLETGFIVSRTENSKVVDAYKVLV